MTFSEPRRFVFLDIDGVLAHFGSNERLDPVCIQYLDDIVESTRAEIILTSSWRDRYGLDAVRQRLAQAGLRAPIADAVPCLPHATRSDEIDAFLVHQGPHVKFVILDDVPVAMHLRAHLVLIDDFVGLTSAAIDLAREILR